MRKILLATTALAGLVAAAPMAQAQTKDSPIDVNIGGYVDFRAGLFNESNDTAAVVNTNTRRHHDFEEEFKVNFDVTGKAVHGVEYGGRISLWNGPTYGTAVTTFGSSPGGGSTIHTADAYVYLAGAYGKVIAGDHNGATDLFVYAPTVGLNQVDGRYTDFLNPSRIAVFMPSFIENGIEYSTKATYLTPQIGNDNNKVQLAVSYAPNFYNAGQSTVLDVSAGEPLYRNVIKAAAQYQGNFSPVTWVFSGQFLHGNANNTMTIGGVASQLNDFTTWGLGTQLGFAGFTVGGSYVDGGSFLTKEGQGKQQRTWSAGVKYELDKFAIAGSYLNGKGYANIFAQQGVIGAGGVAAADHQNYVNHYDVYSVGGTYTWFPGMATQLDVARVRQERADLVNTKNVGNVAVLSQKLTF